MNTQYYWTIEGLECVPTLDNQTNVVSVIHWKVKGIDDTNIVSNYGSIPVFYDNSLPFIPFNELTEAQIINWIKNIFGEQEVQAIELDINTRLLDLKNPQTIMPTLPWSNQ